MAPDPDPVVVVTFGEVGESNPKWDSLPLTIEMEEALPGRPPCFKVLTEGRFKFVARLLLLSTVDSTPLVSGLVRLAVRALDDDEEDPVVPNGGETLEEFLRWADPVSDIRCPGAGITEDGPEDGL